MPTYDDPVDVPSTLYKYVDSQKGPGVYGNAVNLFSGNDIGDRIFNSYSSLMWNSTLQHALSTKKYYAGGDVICSSYTTGWRDRMEWKNDNLDGYGTSRAPGLIGLNAYYRTDPLDWNSSVFTKWSVRGTEWLNNATTGTAYPHQGDNLERLQFGRINSKWVRFEAEFFTMPYRPYESAYENTETRVYFRATGQTWDGGSNYRHYIIHGVGDNAINIYEQSLGYEGAGTDVSSPNRDFTLHTRDWRTVHLGRV